MPPIELTPLVSVDARLRRPSRPGIAAVTVACFVTPAAPRRDSNVWSLRPGEQR